MRIGILGAGAIGGYLAAELSATGVEVALVGRARSLPERAELVAVPLRGAPVAAGSDLILSTDPQVLASSELCLVAVKSNDTAEAAQTLAAVLSPNAPVVSLQNGLSNVTRLRDTLGGRALGGVVGFNVTREGGHCRQTSAGALYLEDAPAHRRVLDAMRFALEAAGERMELRREIERVQAGKLLMNLNNGVCAATGLGIAASLRDADARWCLAQCIREGVATMRAAGMRPARLTPISPSWMARALELPGPIVMTMTAALAPVSPAARSSTLQDLDRGRTTEIDDLNGAIALIAQTAGVTAPLNALVTDIVHQHERTIASGAAPRWVRPAELRRRIRERMTRGSARWWRQLAV